uniref:Matrix metallopeptidase 11a n=1 Tax=Xiphophorus couchianus TaxID=32473 RepID=A0A3B5LWU4_9TELE
MGVLSSSPSAWLLAVRALRHLEIRRPAVPHRRHLRLTSCVCMLTRALVSCRIERFPWQMDEEKVRRVIREAVKIWSDVTPLTFTEVRRGIADIRIDFSSYWHGDNLPFDGPGGILAHAFFPKTHRQGDIHFDYDESWTLGNYMDLLQVAAHEFGHVLGLQHSRKPKTVMSAYYSFSYPLRLSEDDRLGIQYLYGAKPQVLPPPPTPAPRALTDFDAVSMIRGELFFFKSGYVWRIRDPGGSARLESGYPALASRHWKGIPTKIDAAFEDKSGNIWFFQGEYLIKSKIISLLPLQGPESIRSLGLSTSNIQAALRWGHDPNYNIYFFKSGSYWRFSPRENRVESPQPRSMQYWTGIPEDVDAAFRDTHGTKEKMLLISVLNCGCCWSQTLLLRTSFKLYFLTSSLPQAVCFYFFCQTPDCWTYVSSIQFLLLCLVDHFCADLGKYFDFLSHCKTKRDQKFYFCEKVLVFQRVYALLQANGITKSLIF